MRILLTGHCGRVGAPLAVHLEHIGHEVRGFDIRDGNDIRDLAALKKAAEGCAAVVHLAAIPNDRSANVEELIEVNVHGTRHVLAAAQEVGVARVIFFSTVQVLGVAEGEHEPAYFPIDDNHPRGATRPYGLSKCEAEDLCQSFTEGTGIPTVVLRPVAVWEPGQYRQVEQRWRRRPHLEWEPFWEYGAFVDIRDVAGAVEAALSVPLSGHHRALLCAHDIAGSAPGLLLAQRLTPGVPVRDAQRYETERWRALVDCSVAEQRLAWRPRYTWADRPRCPPWSKEWWVPIYYRLARLAHATSRRRRRQ